MKTGHCGTNQLMSQVRDKFWVISLRTMVNKVVRNCATCKSFRKHIYDQPCCPSLATFRCAPWFSLPVLDSCHIAVTGLRARMISLIKTVLNKSLNKKIVDVDMFIILILNNTKTYYVYYEFIRVLVQFTCIGKLPYTCH